MEQYWMPKRLDFRNLRLCIENYTPTYLYIRDCGGVRENGIYECQGRKKVGEDLLGKTFDFRKDSSGLHMIVDSNTVFSFPLKSYQKGFSVAYERYYPKKKGDICETKVILSHGVNPHDSSLPKPRNSVLRTVLDSHLMEIEFKGKIDLKFHSWWYPDFAYWTLDMTKFDSKTKKSRK